MPAVHEYDRVLHLGEGGMGSVWLARSHGGDLVAIKTLKDGGADDARSRALFLKEMRIASAVRHPNVAPVLASGETEDGPYFVMEWVDGLSLRALGRACEETGRVPLAIALRVVADACAGLHAAHELRSPNGTPLGLVHRDVSPHNVLVGRDGMTRLIDFGVAHARERTNGETTSSGNVKGKVRYMAPEQALGRPVDRRADVFAAGVVLYELVTGQRPFDGPNDVAAIQAVVGPTKAIVPPTVPPPVAAVIEKALAKRVGERFASAREMAAAVEEAARAVGAEATLAEVGAFVATVAARDAKHARVANAIAVFEETLCEATRTSMVPAAAELAVTTSLPSGTSRLRPRRTTIVGAAAASALVAGVIGVSLGSKARPAHAEEASRAATDIAAVTPAIMTSPPVVVTPAPAEAAPVVTAPASVAPTAPAAPAPASPVRETTRASSGRPRHAAVAPSPSPVSPASSVSDDLRTSLRSRR